MNVTFTERELDVMSLLWERGSATVAEAREALDDDLAYTTVLTVFRTLEQKGHVRHEEEGKAHRYFPCVARERAGMSALRRMVDKLFAGSPELLLTQLVSDRRLSDAEIRKIRALLDKRIREG